MNVMIQGQLMNIFKTADFKDRETGEVKVGRLKLQLMCESVLSNGETKHELFDITIPDFKQEEYKDKVGEQVNVPCSFYAKGAVTFFGV
jgi:hypothetical protein